VGCAQFFRLGEDDAMVDIHDVKKSVTERLVKGTQRHHPLLLPQ